ncbi:alpha-glucosidase [Tessaracoccus bendigoensis DSM 12906]|uniref:Alpha-glucosidase n=1 Tax=Tessaracoccus bendigoensis DSM 12906 TaxID=1123357 RepID=A0A1M6C2E7_9ACTN|nr:glycoside hydrolase family 13 protein [Tessaracoccus bendigoensis]SHI55225.1 alpha-glucosidase [Tessaracoccus bendigoensis DSM 12906]
MTLSSHDVFNAPDWWRQAVVYQIYPRSFADANGDGIGDLVGITSRVGYLKELGVDAVWLSPFYPSALADGGYDVDDYRDVDPKIGTLDEFDEMVAALHAAQIKVVVDIVPNHSSNRHEWFKAAVAAGKGSPERERYIFRDGKGEAGELPPNAWPSGFGGPAWEQVIEPDGSQGQWYLHLFAKEQPDFNWDHPDVHADFLKTLRFWSDRGVDGFRVDVAHGLKKNLDPAFDAIARILEGTDLFGDGQHPLWDRDEVHEVYAEWRAVFNEYDPPRTAVAEAWVAPHRQARYSSPEGLGQTFNFDLLRARFESDHFYEIIDRNLRAAAEIGGSTTWVFSNHDVVRHATRYGLDGEGMSAAAPGGGATMGGNDGKRWLLDGGDPADVDQAKGLRRARAATLFMLALPGSAYLYQGEELGLQEVGQIPDEARQDPAFFRSEGREIGRDGCRVPLPWTREGGSFGFGPGGAHLPQPAWLGDFAVDVEEGDPGSTLTLYRQALALRHELECAESLTWFEQTATTLGFERPNGWCAVMNFGTEPVELPEGTVLVSSGPLTEGQLPGETTVWVRR